MFINSIQTTLGHYQEVHRRFLGKGNFAKAEQVLNKISELELKLKKLTHERRGAENGK